MTTQTITAQDLQNRDGWKVQDTPFGTEARFTKKFQSMIAYVQQSDGLWTMETPAGTNGPARPLGDWVAEAEAAK